MSWTAEKNRENRRRRTLKRRRNTELNGLNRSYLHFVMEMAARCYCDASNCPCDGLLAGGFCDRLGTQFETTLETE